MESEYCKGHVNSERSLQAMLFANLRAVFAEEKTARRIFVEPTVKLADGSVIRPDIVICNSREAICFLELKYVPRGKADTTKDMRSIASVARSEGIAISLERYRGPKLPPMSFDVSKTVLFAWAGIHAGSTELSEAWNDPAFQGHFYLELHAVTKDGHVPREVQHQRAAREN
ncbi:MAG: hypothetical protein ABSD13_08020 [Candidatus Korobacteraceae bacterium]